MSAPNLTPSAQDYLKAVWTAQEWTDAPVTTTTLGRRLGLSPSSVSEAVRKLTDQGLLTHARYGSIDLTDAGRAVAVSMVRRHRLIETFLVEYLGYTWDQVHEEAEVLEHAVSEAFVDRLEARLGHPARDPHGDPIPRPDGTLPPLSAHRLPDAPQEVPLRVARVSDADPQVLRRLERLALGLDVALVVRGPGRSDGSLRVAVGGREVTVDAGAAAAVWVVG